MSRKPGALIKHADYSKKKCEMLADMLDNMSESNIFRGLEYIVGDKFLEVLDFFQGDRIEFPTIEEIERRIERIDIYEECKRTGNSKCVAVKYKKNIAWIDKVVEDTRQELIEADSDHV